MGSATTTSSSSSSLRVMKSVSSEGMDSNDGSSVDTALCQNETVSIYARNKHSILPNLK
jgi:hypothetical protein